MYAAAWDTYVIYSPASVVRSMYEIAVSIREGHRQLTPGHTTKTNLESIKSLAAHLFLFSLQEQSRSAKQGVLLPYCTAFRECHW